MVVARYKAVRWDGDNHGPEAATWPEIVQKVTDWQREQPRHTVVWVYSFDAAGNRVDPTGYGPSPIRSIHTLR